MRIEGRTASTAFGRMMISILLLVGVLPLPAQDLDSRVDAGVSMGDMEVIFEFKDRLEYGFVEQLPDDLKTRFQETATGTVEGGTQTSPRFPFEWSDAESLYSTKPFYFFVQLFTRDSIWIDYSISPLAVSPADYIPFHVSITEMDKQAAVATVVDIDASTVNSSANLYGPASRNIPDIKSWEFKAYFSRAELVEIEHAGTSDYETTITVTIHSDEGVQGGSV